MSWIDPPLPGRNAMSSSTPQLPPLVQRLGTPSSAPGLNQNFKDFLPSSSRSARCKEHDRGQTAAAWSRKLPCGIPSQALRMVRTHLSPVEDAMIARTPTRLGRAVEEASNGTRYLKTVSVVRRSRSVPALQRHALETALASHIVRAKVELDKWHSGIMEINQLRRIRNPDKLRETLATWRFAEDDPIVLDAREDLDRWRYIEEQMPAVLKRAMEEKDMETISNNLKELSKSGPSSVENSREARLLLRQFESQVQALRQSVSMRDVDAIQKALDQWDFPEDANVEQARDTLDRYEEQLRELKMVVAFERVNGKKLADSVAAWEFENDNADFLQAVDVLQGFRMESEALAQILQQEPVNLLQLRITMDSWSFATDPDSCAAVNDAVVLLKRYEEEVRAALDISDGYALRDLLHAGSDGNALGNEELLAEANALCERHSEASKRLLELVRTAPNLEASATDEIGESCKNWKCAESDPVLQLGRTWLQLQESASERSVKELDQVAGAGFEGPLVGALSRQRAGDRRATAAPEAVMATIGQVWQAAGAVAFGVLPSQLPACQPAGTADALLQELKNVEMARQSCTLESIRELKAEGHPPEYLHCFFQVVQSLLAGSSSWQFAKEDTSWRACQEMMSDSRKFAEYLGEVPTFISTGRRSGAIKARALDAQMRKGPHAAIWSSEGMGETSLLGQSLFVYIECILRLDDLVSANFAVERASQGGKGKGAAGERDSSFDMAWSALQAATKELGGLPDSRQLAAIFLTCGGQLSELGRCETRAQTLLEAMRAQTLDLQASLEDVTPFSVSPEWATEADSRRGVASNSLILSVQNITGKLLGRVEISEVATGTQLKQLIAEKFRFEVPPAAEQKLCPLDAAAAVRDLKSLASQGIQSNTVLKLVRIQVPLLQRLEFLSCTIRALDASSFGPQIKHLAKAASYFAYEGHASKRLDRNLMIFLEFLKDVGSFVQDATEGGRPQNPCMSVCERKIHPRMFEFGELPAYQFTVVGYHLRRFVQASQGEVAVVFSEFIAVLQKLSEEFLPLYLARAASMLAVEEAEAVCRAAADVKTLGQHFSDRRLGVLSLEPAAVLEQLDSMSGMGLLVAAPHVEALSKAAAADVAALLESSDISHPALRSRHIGKLLTAHLSPVVTVTEALKRLGKRLATLPPMPQEIIYLNNAYQLVVAVFQIFAKPGDPDIEFADAKWHLLHPKQLSKQLSTWQPLRDASVDQLRSSQALLLRLWSVLRGGMLHPQQSHNEHHRLLFAWASLATSLVSLLPAAQALAPVAAAVQSAADGMKRVAEETSAADAEEAVWQQVRAALHRSEEPWWWLQLIGCKDPKAFYMRHDLVYDGSSSLPIASNGPSDAAEASSERPREADSNAAPEAELAAADESYADDGDEFDDEKEPSAKGHTFDESEVERDRYSDGFDTEGDASPSKDPASPDSPAKSPDRAYSQDDFEMDNDRPQVQKGYSGFETEEADGQQAPLQRGYSEFENEFEPADAENADATSANFEQGGSQAFEPDDAETGQPPADSKLYSTNEFEFEADEPVNPQPSGYSNGDNGDFEFEDDDSPVAAAGKLETKKAEDEDEFEADEDEFEED